MNELTGFEKRTIVKKRSILDAARNLFFTKGPMKTTIADIAKKAEVSQVSIYNYFKNKDKLLDIVITEHLEASLAKLEKIMELDIPFQEKIVFFFSARKEKKKEFNEESLKNFNWESPGIQKIYNKFVVNKQIPFLMRFIEMGKEDGTIKKELSTEAIMAFFSANMSIYKEKDFLKKGSSYIETLRHLFFYGLLGQ